MTVVPPVDRPVDRPQPSVDRPVDRPAPESGVLSIGRPTIVAGLCAHLVHIGRLVRSTDPWSGRLSSRPPVWSG